MRKKVSLTRRGFLRLSVIAAGSAVAVACQKAVTQVVGTSTPLAPPTLSVTLDLGGNRDVWAWTSKVQVNISDGQCDSVTLDVNQREFEAQPEGNSFTSEVTISEGENRVSAICKTDAGEARSESVILTGRLRQTPRATIQIALEAGQITLDGSESRPSDADDSPITEYVWSAREDNPEPLQDLNQ